MVNELDVDTEIFNKNHCKISALLNTSIRKLETAAMENACALSDVIVIVYASP